MLRRPLARLRALPFAAVAAAFVLPAIAPAGAHAADLEEAVLDELNYVRAHPVDYASELRRAPDWAFEQEEPGAVEEAIDFLERQQPLAPLKGDARVRPGVLPAGEYATLTYRGQDVRSNGHLIDWVAEQGREFDRDRTPEGDAFASRCEFWATDPRAEKRKKQRYVRLEFLLRPGAAR